MHFSNFGSFPAGSRLAALLLFAAAPLALAQRFEGVFDHHELRMRESASSTLCNSFSNTAVAESPSATTTFPLQLVPVFPCENSLQAAAQLSVNFPAGPLIVVTEGDLFRLEDPTTIRPSLQATASLIWRTAARSVVETTISSAVDDGIAARNRCGYHEVNATMPVANPSYQTTVSSECALNRLPGGLTSFTIESNLTIKLKRNVELDEVKFVVLSIYRLRPAIPPALATEPSALSFTAPSGNPASQSLRISNTGGGSLDWVARAIPVPDEAGNWLTVSPASGSLGQNTSTTIEVRINTERFESGRPYTGTIEVSSSAGAPAKSIAITAELLTDIAVDRIEVTQVVQGAGNPVPLVAGKPAIARVFARLDDRRRNPLPMVSGLLRRVGGGERASGPITVPRIPDRNRLEDSLNFEIPADWIQNDALELQAELSLPPGREARIDNNTLVERVAVSTTPPLPEQFQIAWLRFCLQPPGVERTCAGASRFGDLHQTLPAVFPLPPAAVRFDYLGTATFREPLRRSTTHRFLQKLRRWDVLARQGGMQYDQLFAWLPPVPAPAGDSGDRPPVGRADMRRLGANGRSGRVAFGQESIRSLGVPKAGFLLAHQIGHNLGLQHPNLSDSCGAVDAVSLWPYLTSTIQETGIDVGLRLLRSPSGISPVVDMMSQCWMSGPSGAWISPDSFARLRAGRLRPQPHPSLSEPAAPVDMETDGDFVMVSGTVRRDGSAGTLLPIFKAAASSATDAAESGSHCLQFSGGTATRRYCFTPDFIDDDDGQSLDEDSFTLVVPRPAGSRQLVLSREESRLASWEAAFGTPVVNISTPQPGTLWQSGAHEVAWSATLEGGRPLTYALLYSADGGSRWTPLELDWTETSLTVNTADLNGASVLFRLITSDGWNQGETIVGPITIEQSPLLSSAAQQLSFGKVVVGASSARELTVRSTGNTLAQIVRLPTGNSAFAVEFPSPPIRIPAGGEDFLKLRFTPIDPGLTQSRLQIENNGSASPIEVILDGKGVLRPEPDAAFAPASLDFGFTAVGQSSQADLQLRNLGPGDLNLLSASFSDSQFTLATTLLPLVPAGGQQSLSVRFRPTAGGTKTASLLLSTNDPDHLSLSVPLRGEATVPQAPVLQFSPATLDFGTVTVGQPKNLTLFVVNGGNVPLHVAGLTVSNVVFLATPSSLTVAPGAQALVTIRFAAASPGAQSGLLSMATNDPQRGIVQILVSAVAVAPVGQPAVDVNPASLSFGDVSVGQSKELPLNVRNSGAAPLRVDSVLSTNAAFRAVAPSFPISLQPGAQQPVTIRFSPVATGALTVTLGVTTNDPVVPTLAIVASGAGTAATPQGAVLQVDDGTFESSVNYSGGDAYFLNRLTPPRYPATLRAVQIFFPLDDGLPAGENFTVITAVNPDGSPILGQVLLRTTNARLVVRNRFTEYIVPAVTIQSGDFLVGFVVSNNEGIRPLAIDTSSVPQNRSYLGRNGLTFAPVGSVDGQTNGNFAIRARIDLAP